MPSIKVALVVSPGMLRDILYGILRDVPDIEVVGNYGDIEELLGERPRRGADVVVLGGKDGQLGAMSLAFLERNPRSSVLAVTAEGRNTSLVQLGPTRTVLGQVSVDELVGAIRLSAAPRPWNLQIENEAVL